MLRGGGAEPDRGRDQRPAHCEPDRDRDQEDGVAQSETANAAITSARAAAGSSDRHPVGAHRPDRPARIELDQRPRGRRLDEPSPSRVSACPDHDQQQPSSPAPLALGRDRGARRSTTSLQQRHDERDRDHQDPDPEEEPEPPSYMRQEAERIWPHARRRAGSSGVAGRQVGAGQAERASSTRARARAARAWLVHEPPQDVRASRDRAAEEVRRARAEHAAGRDRVAAAPPSLRPRDRLGPLRPSCSGRSGR